MLVKLNFIWNENLVEEIHLFNIPRKRTTGLRFTQHLRKAKYPKILVTRKGEGDDREGSKSLIFFIMSSKQPPPPPPTLFLHKRETQEENHTENKNN